MAVSTTTSARAPETEGSQTDLNEPSMEDILASIRRIIAEDQSNSLGRSGLGGLMRRPAPGAPPEREPERERVAVAEDLSAAPEILAADVTPELVEAPHGDMLRGSYASAPDTLFEVAERSHESEHPTRTEAADMHDAKDQHLDDRPAFAVSASDHEDMYEDDPEPLMSPVTGASITSSFQTLAESVMLQDPGLVERIMRETLRPMLKTWLDDHLPSIVERLVRTEIERVARGGRGRD